MCWLSVGFHKNTYIACEEILPCTVLTRREDISLSVFSILIFASSSLPNVTLSSVALNGSGADR